MVTGTRARQVNDQEARDFGISTDRACLEIEQIFYDADDDVLRHTITVDYSGQPYVTWHVPTAEELARREAGPGLLALPGDRRIGLGAAGMVLTTTSTAVPKCTLV
ncbi:hypothetical protein ACFQ3Z_46300 [Streptomyces nogalater]